jgi:hypothetical protein
MSIKKFKTAILARDYKNAYNHAQNNDYFINEMDHDENPYVILFMGSDFAEISTKDIRRIYKICLAINAKCSCDVAIYEDIFAKIVENNEIKYKTGQIKYKKLKNIIKIFLLFVDRVFKYEEYFYNFIFNVYFYNNREHNNNKKIIKLCKKTLNKFLQLNKPREINLEWYSKFEVKFCIKNDIHYTSQINDLRTYNIDRMIISDYIGKNKLLKDKIRLLENKINTIGYLPPDISGEKYLAAENNFAANLDE